MEPNPSGMVLDVDRLYGVQLSGVLAMLGHLFEMNSFFVLTSQINAAAVYF